MPVCAPAGRHRAGRGGRGHAARHVRAIPVGQVDDARLVFLDRAPVRAVCGNPRLGPETVPGQGWGGRASGCPRRPPGIVPMRRATAAWPDRATRFRPCGSGARAMGRCMPEAAPAAKVRKSPGRTPRARGGRSAVRTPVRSRPPPKACPPPQGARGRAGVAGPGRGRARRSRGRTGRLSLLKSAARPAAVGQRVVPAGARRGPVATLHSVPGTSGRAISCGIPGHWKVVHNKLEQTSGTAETIQILLF